jgi:glycosyltransferase involved in cell wall biosynthesis
MPKLSIGIPVFNGQEFLPELLGSLLAQTFKDFEILICDNASSDRTPQICCEYERHDSRIHYIRNERNLEAIANYNRLFELSTAPLFKWAAHDDLHHEAYLNVCARLLEENPDINLAHTGTAFIDERARSSPSNKRQGALSIQRLEGGIGRTSRALAIPQLPSTDFGRCSRVPAGGLHLLRFRRER